MDCMMEKYDFLFKISGWSFKKTDNQKKKKSSIYGLHFYLFHNPLKTCPEYYRAGVQGKCLLLQNQIVFNGLLLMSQAICRRYLKGKFSSGIEGALASTLNHNFRNYSLYLFFYVFKVYLSSIDSETAEIYKKGDFEFWVWAPHFIMIWNITIRYKFWRTYLFQDA